MCFQVASPRRNSVVIFSERSQLSNCQRIARTQSFHLWPECPLSSLLFALQKMSCLRTRTIEILTFRSRASRLLFQHVSFHFLIREEESTKTQRGGQIQITTKSVANNIMTESNMFKVTWNVHHQEGDFKRKLIFAALSVVLVTLRMRESLRTIKRYVEAVSLA